VRALTDLVPLRSTVAWGQYKSVRPIPLRYGDCVGELIPYDSTGRVWVWGDGSSSVIREVVLNGAITGGWAWRNGRDNTGRGVTFVEFAAPIEQTATVAAAGTGRLHSRTGAPITNPADVIFDLLANVLGNPATESDVDLFRAEAARLGLSVGGTVDGTQSTQQVCAEICASVGAVYSPRMPGIAKVFPGESLDSYARGTIDYRSDIGNPESGIDSVYTAAVLNYDFQLGQATQSIELEAPDAIPRFGRRVLTIDAMWLTNPRAAYDVAARALAFRSRPQVSLTALGIRGELLPGQTVNITHPRSPIQGIVMVQAADVDFVSRTSDVRVVAALGPVPRITIVRQSAAADPTSPASATVQTIGGERVLYVKDLNGAPLANALVVLDGQYQRQSDAGGRVAFPASIMPAGTHRLAITTGAGVIEIQVVVP
jgi:hypothetical protein